MSRIIIPIPFLGWCTNCDATWTSGPNGYMAKYAIIQEVQNYYWGYYDYFSLAEVTFIPGESIIIGAIITIQFGGGDFYSR